MALIEWMLSSQGATSSRRRAFLLGTTMISENFTIPNRNLHTKVKPIIIIYSIITVSNDNELSQNLLNSILSVVGLLCAFVFSLINHRYHDQNELI